MVNVVRFLTDFGSLSLSAFWIPVVAWTAVASLFFLADQKSKRTERSGQVPAQRRAPHCASDRILNHAGSRSPGRTIPNPVEHSGPCFGSCPVQ